MLVDADYVGFSVDTHPYSLIMISLLLSAFVGETSSPSTKGGSTDYGRSEKQVGWAREKRFGDGKD
ncbi:MAG: hypothetical protein AMXMBFR74_28980 [Parvibaculum sp.]